MADRRSATVIESYQDYRTRRFLRQEAAWSTWLPSWRTRRRRRTLVVALGLTFAVMLAVGVLTAAGLRWAPLIWLPATLAFAALWTMLQVVVSRQADAPATALDEYEMQQRNSARSIGLTVTQYLTMLPVAYLIVGGVITHGTDENMAYAGGLLALTTLMIGGATPAAILAWTRDDPDPDGVSADELGDGPQRDA
ncbi:hypothetical protein LV457_19320 [Mycobacterium sp. MYCO198283]|uniref:hypothetical protein n=1 Tax=Mycobacterium sp. MYCO198283 TaxID=2883505 RepID=UPI001E42D1F7|nr:hypothetical protein [Mycobacterium sp. MYCO198283]MCG5434427.1 hypothetical protein [Mycobacterium sp. MYCO198283]